jgi:hypothetical protein
MDLHLGYETLRYVDEAMESVRVKLMESVGALEKLVRSSQSSKVIKLKAKPIIEEIRRLEAISIELSNESVGLASQMYDVVDQQVRSLDNEARRGRMELFNEKGDEILGKYTNAAEYFSAPIITVTNADMPVNPNELVYCLCNQAAYGEMVACDNENCMKEWFHLGCVNLTEIPEGKLILTLKHCQPLSPLPPVLLLIPLPLSIRKKGKWFCPSCDVTNRWRKRKVY